MKLTICLVVCLQLCALLLADPIPQQQGQCSAGEFTVTADNELRLYVDGVQLTPSLPNANTWTAPDTVTVSSSAKVIAIRGVDVGQIGGILASGADATTDASWRCSAVHTPGWVTVDFDDSHWPQAKEIGAHGVSPWGTIAGISADAKWIWTENYQYGDKTVYCRKTRNCNHNTGPTCITSCSGQDNGDYQHCSRCDVYVTCSNQILYDNRPCAPSNPALVWDDTSKSCDWESSTCTPL